MRRTTSTTRDARLARNRFVVARRKEADLNEPAVSVVIPTRNRLEYLQLAIRSVLHQSLRELECLVIDDRSDDGTRQWLESVDDPRVRPILLDRSRERSAARNTGLEATRAPFVLFLDDDDLLARHGLEAGLRTAHRFPQAAMIVGRQVAFDETGHRRAERHPESRWPVGFWRATSLA